MNGGQLKVQRLQTICSDVNVGEQALSRWHETVQIRITLMAPLCGIGVRYAHYVRGIVAEIR